MDRRSKSIAVVAGCGAIACALWVAAPSVRRDVGAQIHELGARRETGAARGAANTTATRRRDRVDSHDPQLGRDPSPAARETRERLEAVTNALAASHAKDPRHAEYVECRRRGDGCGDLFTDLTYAAFYGGVYQQLDEDGFGIQAAIADHGASAVHGVIADVLARSADPLERTAALAVLERVDELGAYDLPLDAYRGLSSLSVVEQQLLLGRHASRPIWDGELAEEVSALGVLTADERVIAAALGALAHPETDRELAALTERVRLDTGTRLELERVVGRCADACPETLASLLRRTEPDARQALHAAVHWTDDSRIAALQDAVRRLSQGRVVLSAN